MASLGETLRTERERRRRSLSEAAAATRVKIQILEALERNDFSSIAAPIYGKGFIRLYAAYLNIDPGPLIQEYIGKASPVTPTLDASVGPAGEGSPGATAGKPDEGADIRSWQATADALGAAASGSLDRLITALRSLRLPEGRSDAGGKWKPVSLAAAVLLVLLLLASAVSRCARVPKKGPAHADVRGGASMELAEEPPEPSLK